MVVFAQLDLDVGVGGADGSRGGVREVQAGTGQADVIDDGDHFFGGNLGADGRVDVIAERGGLFDAGTGACANVNLELAGIYRGEEVLPSHGSNRKTEPSAKTVKRMRKNPALSTHRVSRRK